VSFLSPSEVPVRRSAEWGTPLLVALLVAVHLATALFEWAQGYEDLGPAAILGRTERFRIDVGGQFRPLVHQGEIWRLATGILLHADGAHLLLNALAIGTLGRLLEPWVGSLRLLSWFILGGVAGAILSDITGVFQSDGASGGAFALLGALAVLSARRWALLSEEERRWLGPALWVLVALNLVLSAALPFVNLAGHIGGLATGLALGLRHEGESRRSFWFHGSVVGLFSLILIWGAIAVGWS
jgi:rhomboid protease GluP